MTAIRTDNPGAPFLLELGSGEHVKGVAMQESEADRAAARDSQGDPSQQARLLRNVHHTFDGVVSQSTPLEALKLHQCGLHRLRGSREQKWKKTKNVLVFSAYYMSHVIFICLLLLAVVRKRMR